MHENEHILRWGKNFCDLCFFFFKQKTAYEIYQCDWSSDVCSSDLSVPIFMITPWLCWSAKAEAIPITMDTCAPFSYALMLGSTRECVYCYEHL